MSEIDILEKLSKAVIDGDEEAAKKFSKNAIEAGISPLKAIKEGLEKGILIIGERFHKFEAFLPEVILAADAMKAGVSILEPMIEAEKLEYRLGKVVIGTVFGDIHDIGKNIVSTMLSVSGFEVHDLGVDVPAIKFVDKAIETEADIIAMSSLLTPSMHIQRDILAYMKDMEIREKCYAVVGGGSVTPSWAEQIGADGYAKEVDGAVKICKLFMSEKTPSPLRETIIID